MATNDIGCLDCSASVWWNYFVGLLEDQAYLWLQPHFFGTVLFHVHWDGHRFPICLVHNRRGELVKGFDLEVAVALSAVVWVGFVHGSNAESPFYTLCTLAVCECTFSEGTFSTSCICVMPCSRSNWVKKIIWRKRDYYLTIKIPFSCNFINPFQADFSAWECCA